MKDWFAEQAAHYDESEHFMFDPAVIARTVDVLQELAGDGPALELAIGTGRIGLPLAQRGVEVHGIEYSEPMAEQLRKKRGGADIPVTIGDMTTTRLETRFRLVYLVFNTIDNLTTQDAQVACFENAAAHLEPGGCFVVEVGVPQLQRLPVGERFVPFHVGENHVGIDEYDVVTQSLWSHHVTARGKTAMPFRYVWPSELDLMARIAGMRLRDRWADWDRSPFTATSEKHVSVWTCGRAA
jgi:SAM-dependent methyltransferase